MPSLVGDEHKAAAQFVRQCLATHKDGRDLIEIGAYKPGTNPKLDQAIARMGAIDAFLKQGMDELTSFRETAEMLALLVRGAEALR